MPEFADMPFDEGKRSRNSEEQHPATDRPGNEAPVLIGDAPEEKREPVLAHPLGAIGFSNG